MTHRSNSIEKNRPIMLQDDKNSLSFSIGIESLDDISLKNFENLINPDDEYNYFEWENMNVGFNTSKLEENTFESSIWSIGKIEEILQSPTDPRGKFMRDLNISAKDALMMDLMDYLESAPRRERRKYGKRKHLSEEERLTIAKQRNREHAKATRERRKLFSKIIERHINKLDNKVFEFLEKSNEFKHLKSWRYRKETVENFFDLMDTGLACDESKWLDLTLKGVLCKFHIVTNGISSISETCGWNQAHLYLSNCLQELQKHIIQSSQLSEVYCLKENLDISPVCTKDIKSELESDEEDMVFMLNLIDDKQQQEQQVQQEQRAYSLQRIQLFLLENSSFDSSVNEWFYKMKLFFNLNTIDKRMNIIVYESIESRLTLRFLDDQCSKCKISSLAIYLDLDDLKHYLNNHNNIKNIQCRTSNDLPKEIVEI